MTAVCRSEVRLMKRGCLLMITEQQAVQLGRSWILVFGVFEDHRERIPVLISCRCRYVSFYFISSIPIHFPHIATFFNKAAQLVTCTAMTVPIVIAPFGTAPVHKALPLTPSNAARIPLPSPPAVAPRAQHHAKGFGGSSSDTLLLKKVYVPKHINNFKL